MGHNIWVEQTETRIKLMSRTAEGKVFCWMDISKASINDIDLFTGVCFNDAVRDVPKTDDTSRQ